jgi:hypothetical protein
MYSRDGFGPKERRPRYNNPTGSHQKLFIVRPTTSEVRFEFEFFRIHHGIGIIMCRVFVLADVVS